VPTHPESDRHLLLGGGERHAESLLEAGHSVQCELLLDLRSVVAGHLCGHSCDALLVGEDTARRPDLLPVTAGRATASSFARTVSTTWSSTETGRP
jgi:hypothetical protein